MEISIIKLEADNNLNNFNTIELMGPGNLHLGNFKNCTRNSGVVTVTLCNFQVRMVPND